MLDVHASFDGVLRVIAQPGELHRIDERHVVVAGEILIHGSSHRTSNRAARDMAANRSIHSEPNNAAWSAETTVCVEIVAHAERN